MNILITGSSGFIGTNLVSALELKGHKVFHFVSGDGDITDFNFIKKYKEIKIDYVYHLAGKTFVPDSWDDPSSFFKTNTLGTLNILKFCDQRKIPMIFVSAYIYGNKVSLPISENSDAQPNNPYALSKYMAENLCFFYSKFNKLKINIFRPFNVYGIGQDARFLIPEILSSVQNNRIIEVNDFFPKRDYIYIDDLVDGLVKGMEFIDGFEVYNLGSGYSLSVKEIIDIIQKITNSNLEVISKESKRTNEINDVISDISKAKNKLGWYPKFSFEDGIKNILEGQN